MTFETTLLASIIMAAATGAAWSLANFARKKAKAVAATLADGKIPRVEPFEVKQLLTSIILAAGVGAYLAYMGKSPATEADLEAAAVKMAGWTIAAEVIAKIIYRAVLRPLLARAGWDPGEW